MSPRLIRTEALIEDCERHLRESQAFGTEIESYLTQHILVILCNEIQEQIYEIAGNRGAAGGDIPLASYTLGSSKRILRGPKMSELKGFVGLFSETAKAEFETCLTESEVTIYNNAVKMRDDVAHHSGAQITFAELRHAKQLALKVLGSMEQVLARTFSSTQVEKSAAEDKSPRGEVLHQTETVPLAHSDAAKPENASESGNQASTSAPNEKLKTKTDSSDPLTLAMRVSSMLKTGKLWLSKIWSLTSRTVL